MSRKRYQLPSLNALAAFEAAARHRGFKRAAGELNVTPAAVSHQIKSLERDLGISMFQRHRRGVELTDNGALLFAALQHGFSHISDTIRRIRNRSDHAPVTISATTAVSSLWLTPRLARFWKDNGHIAVDQQVSDAPERGSGADVMIKYGQMSEDTGDCRLLFTDKIRPLASPSFAAANPARNLRDLANLPLIHLKSPENDWTAWHDWFALLGYDGPIPKGIAVNNYIIALQAAQDDMGVVLGWRGLTEPMVRSGALVPLTGHEIATPNDFYIKLNTDAPDRARKLRDWLVASAES